MKNKINKIIIFVETAIKQSRASSIVEVGGAENMAAAAFLSTHDNWDTS